MSLTKNAWINGEDNNVMNCKNLSKPLSTYTISGWVPEKNGDDYNQLPIKSCK